MKLKNAFSQEVRLLYLYVYACMKCQRSDQGLEIHHITGRDSASAFNSIAICKECHAKVGHTQKEERDFFILTIDFLAKEGYKPTTEDWQFIQDHPWIIEP
jgi:5-methylcytosine-specific restriction endonuclease McrA